MAKGISVVIFDSARCIRITSVADFQKWLYMNGVGQSVRLVFVRNGREYLAVDYTIEERAASARPR